MPPTHALVAQLRRVWHLSGRWLPRGWFDALRQLVLFAGAYYAYRIVRGVVDGHAVDAFTNARDIVSAERGMGLFFEPGLQHWVSNHMSWLIDVSSWCYVNLHLIGTSVFMLWLYFKRRDSFPFVRNMFMIAMGLALVGYMVFPTAPPRYLPEWGFTDSVARLTGLTAADSSAGALYNPFAAVPWC